MVEDALAEDLPGREGDRQPLSSVELLGRLWEGDAGLVGDQDEAGAAIESTPRVGQDDL